MALNDFWATTVHLSGLKGKERWDCSFYNWLIYLLREAHDDLEWDWDYFC